MNRFALTLSVSTVVFFTALATLIGLIVSLPFTSIQPMTVGYSAMIVAGISMLLRERVFTHSS